MGERIWLHACVEFAEQSDIEATYVDALHAFAYPNPRGGPPPPPEPRWRHDFVALEQKLCAQALADPSVRSKTAEDLAHEVDADQAQMFARRIAAVEAQLIELNDATGRLLRVGLRQRLVGILRAPRPRALRVRALADYYYSFAGRWLHARSHDSHRSLVEEIENLVWTPVFEGASLARIDGVFAQGPVHAHVLRLHPRSVKPQVVDCRAWVQTPFADYVQRCGAVAAVSGGFFLYSEPDIEPPCARFDPVAMLVCDGVVHNPPLFGRGALTFDAHGDWSVRRMSLEGMCMAHGDASIPLTSLYTRAQDEVGPDVPSLAVVGRQVVATGTRLPIPLGGFVVPTEVTWSRGAQVRYSAPLDARGHPIVHGIAGGPLLLREGQPCIDVAAEGFWGTAPPRTFSQDETGDRNCLPRLAAGIDDEGRLLLVAIDGRNFSRALGMTLAQTAALMQGLGCHVATNLDGGSSKRMVVEGRAVDLASTEVETDARRRAPTRPVHTAVLFFPPDP